MSQQPPRNLLLPIALSLSLPWLVSTTALAQPLPAGFASVAGGVSVASPNASTLNITQSTPRAIAQWRSFSIGANGTVNVAQPGAGSVLLNRVTGGQLSTIAGQLNANGQVYLVNPAGVLFSSGSSVNVGGLVASTLDIDNNAFMAGGRLTFQRAASSQGAGTVVNQGKLNAGNGGPIILMGSFVVNSGTITADGGTVGLASGGQVTLDVGGDGLTNIVVAADRLASAGAIGNTGQLLADGGRVALVGEAVVGNLVVNQSGTVRARTLATRNGEIILGAGQNGRVESDDGVFDATGTQSPGQRGGNIAITGGQIALNGTTSLDASGSVGGGTILVQAQRGGDFARAGGGAGIVEIDRGARIRADATAAGTGGDVRILGDEGLRVYGSISAQGGAAGGDGGRIETTSRAIDADGIRVDAGASGGRLGNWLVSSADVLIVPGAASGSVGQAPFTPLPQTRLQDADLSAALNTGTNVTVTTVPLAGGSITMQRGARIEYSAARGPLELSFDAHRSVRGDFGTSIASFGAGGPLNVSFTANANGAAGRASGQVSFGGSIFSNGGDVAMMGAWASVDNFGCSICLVNAAIDTRAGNRRAAATGSYSGGSDAGAGGSVRLSGNSSGNGGSTAPTTGAVWMQDSTITSASGNVIVAGSHSAGSGVQIEQTHQRTASIATTSGSVAVTGLGSFAAQGSEAPGHGVALNGAQITSASGNIALHGLRRAGGAAGGVGVLLRNGALVSSGGDIDVTGQSDAGGAGVNIAAAAPVPGGPAAPAARIDGSRNVVIRAASDGSTDALAIGGTVRAGNALNLRPGGLDAAGVAHDRPAEPIRIGGGAADRGFAVSAGEFTRIETPTLVVGSDAHAADIEVAGSVSTASALTLQNGAGGHIRLDAPVSAPQLALLGAGDITQADSAPVTASSLLARSVSGSVGLRSPRNNVATVGGGAANGFGYVDADALTIGPVSATGFNAASNLPQPVSSTTLSAATVLVRTLRIYP